MINTKAEVFAATWLHSRLGEIGCGSDCVYLGGMTPPSSNEWVASVNPGIGMALPFSCAVTALTAAMNAMALKQNLRVNLMVSFLLTSPQHIRAARIAKQAGWEDAALICCG